ncbi:MAG: hypothetical protein ABJF10_26020 [Chthoniobacter sp.]|uniref:hypothetical protein n=1 Tax=Chthoniobacter sp. TaxID=2510640 RepID=UPI0032A4C6EB
MSRRAVNREGPSPLEWIESAVRLLRSAPPGALLCYYFGSATCLLGLLYFWADMSRGAFAAGHLIESAFNAAALYVWMKCWQAVFLSKLRAHLFMVPETPWTLGRITRLVLVQATFQPAGLFLRLIAANVLIPYIWTYSLFMGIAIMGDGTEPSLRVVLRGAVREAGLWWRETHLALLSLFGFAFFICLNVNVVCALLPLMLRTFLGIETVFTRDGWTMFNTTFFAATFAATYLCFDPLRKAVFLVRHFHGQSLQSGEDLRVELRTLRSRSRLAVAALLVAATLLGGPMNTLRAAEAPAAPPPAAQVDSSQLSSSLDRVLERREYAWRFPRTEQPEAEEKGWLSGFLDSVVKTFARWFKRMAGWMEKFVDWLKHLWDSEPEKESKAPLNLDWGTIAKGTLVILAVVLVVLLGMLFWRARKRQREIVVAEAAVPMPDLNEESVTADQLPEDGWLHLGRELMAKGELRLALRAFYLASLAHLGQRELIRLERYKSNHDYDRELQRRARGNGTLLAAFDENLLAFERGWYGDHAVTPVTLDGFSRNVERMKAC